MSDVSDRWSRVQTLFEQATDRPADERTAWLRSVCGDDREVYDHVAAMLYGEANQHAIFGGRAIDLIPPASGGDTIVPSRAGERVGPWVLGDRIGTGGMGAVYRAERDGDFEQTAALKRVKRGMDSEAVLARFRSERRILARLEHPGIARLLDGGLDDDGRPYFAMEYVDGEPITASCDTRRLGVDERLRLFEGVCEAVAYAHRSLVVHRDLKPSNVLVTVEGEVKLLDFGIARVLSDDTEADLTRTGQRVFTPGYAAPEQVRGEAPTTSTDVYALGVLLYGLVSGAKPIETADRSPTEVERAVLDETPRRPSAAVDPEAAQARGTTASALADRLAGDLDTICLKALEKEPERRYGSAAELLADIRRHREGFPIEARPATRRYRAGLFVRRHRGAVVATASGLVALVALTGFYTARLAAERDRAETEAVRAEAEAATAEQTALFLSGLFEGARPNDGPELTASELLAVGASQIENDLVDQPATQADLYVVVGSVYRALAAFDSSEAYLGRALDIRRALGDSLGVADAQTQLATTARRAGDPERAVDLHRRAVAILRTDPEAARGLLGHALASLGAAFHDLARYEEAETAYREGIDRLAGLPDQADGYDSALGNLAGLLGEQGRYEQAVEIDRRLIASRVERNGEVSTPVAIAVGRYAVHLHDLGDLDAAERAYRRALDIDRRMLGDDHPDVAYGLKNLGVLLYDRKDYAAAEEMYRESLSIRRAALDPGHPLIGSTLTSLGNLYADMDRAQEAEALFRESLALLQAAYGDDHPRVAQVFAGRGRLAGRQGDHARSEADYREATRILRGSLGEDNQFTALYAVRHADALRLLGREAEADAAFAAAMPTARTSVPEGSPNRAVVELLYGEHLASQGQCSDALTALDVAADIFREIGDEARQADVRQARRICVR